MFKAFILALFLAACDSGNVVHVTGAVSRPGNVALRKATTIEDAIAQAGGLTDEGDRSRLQVFRVVPPALLVRIPPEQIDSLQAGDTVHIPHRSYPVQIDSVKEVRNVDFVHEARRYKLGEGQLVHGYTKGDVQVAILLGHGLVEAQTGGGSTAGFHYLYARMHPDQFERLTPFVTRHATQPSTRADALEDAAIIQKKLFFRTDHTDGEKAILPPPGHFEIFAGAYPLPRSAAHPGPGMQRRVYDDGRVWTTFGDGRQRTRFPDGMLVRLNAEGTRRTEFPDNRVEIKYPWGDVRIEHPDGTIELRKASGTRVVDYPSGRKRTTLDNRTNITIETNGDRRVLYENGVSRIVRANGVIETTYPDGQIETRLLNGWTEIKTPDGRVARVDPTRSIQKQSGSTSYLLANGGRMWHDPDSRVMTVLPDGTHQIHEGTGGTDLFSDVGWDLESLNTTGRSDYLNEEEKRVILELNKARTDPRRYAEEVIKPILGHYGGRLLKLPGRPTIQTLEGDKPAQELYDHLKQMAPRSPLWPAEGMCLAATDFIEDQVSLKSVWYDASDGRLPRHRIRRHGRAGVTGGAIAYGNSDRGLIVAQFLVNDGIEDREDRRTLLDSTFTAIGVAIGPHDVFGSVCDIVLADNFIKSFEPRLEGTDEKPD